MERGIYGPSDLCPWNPWCPERDGFLVRAVCGWVCVCVFVFVQALNNCCLMLKMSCSRKSFVGPHVGEVMQQAAAVLV